MNKYNVYAIGNALVDMEFAIDDEFLTRMNIDKGVMTLVDTDQQQALYDALAGHTGKMASGGSAANTIIAVSHFGGKAFYSCKVASDPAGDFYVQDLVAAGVDTNLHQQREDGISGKCIVMITPDAERTMHTNLGISETVSEAELHTDAISASDYVYLEGYLVTSNSGRAAAIKAREIAEQSNVKTALTFSDPNMVRFFKDGLGEMLGGGVDLLFCNREEALTWAETDNIETAAEALKSIAKSYAITLGKDGALLFDGSTTIQVPATPVQAVDTNGAGDMFAGAFLYGLTHGYCYEQAGLLATKAAAELVTQFGPRLKPEQHKSLLG
ncbi:MULTISPECIES: adenosine kinase [unclassified Ketobacter]|uniref:adenosine kinase n=1 Tax=unclassified Ketobacter TaxID=2639109 RepID=UPI000F110D6B|nr:MULTISPECIES: adenosine kinase [unclassified Ketobacter]RLT91118.1 MAG: adenosine kinase [Ketobacter sp. GenoA1]RLT98447.1 MAG: adenosine kinase [Ketobacter sp.]